MRHETDMYKSVEVDLTPDEWTSLRILLPKKIAGPSPKYQLDKGDLILMKSKLKNCPSPDAVRFGTRFLEMLELENPRFVVVNRVEKPKEDSVEFQNLEPS